MTSTLTLRTSNLKLPPSFVELDREEMSYVTGGLGWQKCTSVDAYLAISNIIADAVGWGMLASKILPFAIGTAATGVGAVASVFAVIGSILTIVAAGLNGAVAIAATTLLVRDGGFQLFNVGVFGHGVSMLKPLK